MSGARDAVEARCFLLHIVLRTDQLLGFLEQKVVLSSSFIGKI